MISKGFRTDSQGVMITKNKDPGYHLEECMQEMSGDRNQNT